MEHFTIVLILQKSNLRQIPIYKQLNQMHFHYQTSIQFLIPSKVSKIHSGAFLDLLIVEISEDSELESFPLSDLRYCSHFLIMIPSTLKKLIHDIRFH